ncbi:MAG: hypothetical protein WC421_06640 [Elusimicrobiales bacterium]
MGIAVILLYLAVMFFIAAKTRNTSDEEFFIGTRNESGVAVALTERAAGESAWLIVGLTGLAYSIGLKAFWVVFGETVFCACSWLFLAPLFQKRINSRGYGSIIDFLENRYDDKLRIIRVISALIVILLVPTYFSAQLSAVSKVFHMYLGTNQTLGCAVVGTIICLYTFLGGATAIFKINLMQAGLMFGGLVLVFSVLLHKVLLTGSVPVLFLTSLWGSGRPSDFADAGSFFAIGLGFLGIPHLYTKFLSLKRTENIRKISWIPILFTLICDSLAVFIGIMGKAIYPNLLNPESIFMHVSMGLPSVLTGLLVCSILAAALSTADTLLLFVTQVIVKDTVQKLISGNQTPQTAIRFSKMTMIVITAMAILTGIGDNRFVFWMVLLAWSTLASSFNPLIIMGLTNRRISANIAIAGLVSGALSSILWNIFFAARTGIYEMIIGFLISFAVMGILIKTHHGNRADETLQ